MKKGVPAMNKTFYTACSVIILTAFATVVGGCKTGEKFEAPKIPFITAENVHGVMAPDDNNIWIVGNYGTIHHSSDGGKNWVSQDSGIKTLLVDGVFIDSKTGWVIGIDGVIIHTTDGGATWVKQNSGTTKHLFGISFTDKDYGWAVGEYSTIIHTTDGGATWVSQQPEADKIYNNVHFVDRQNGFIVGEAGAMVRTTDGGATWMPVMPKIFERESLEDEYERPRPTLFCVTFTDARNGWACGNFGVILHTTDGGATWDPLNSNTDLPLYTIFIKNGRGWCVGDKGAYLTSGDGGLTWKFEEETIKSKLWFRDVFFTSPKKGWIVGASGTVISTEDGGTNWEFHSGLSYDSKAFAFFNDILARFEKMMSE
jgi:photosystem II stability/assembly factor-like uncharacterized protein